MERELDAPIDVATADGRLRRDAVGWSRHPLHRFNVPRTLARACGWNYWCVTSRECSLTILVADVGFAGVAFVSVLDHARPGAPIEHAVVRPFGIALPPSPSGDVVVERPSLRLALREVDGGLRFEVAARTVLRKHIEVDLAISRPRSHESVNVLVPFDDTAFQFTSKQQALAARGVVRVDARSYRFDADTDAWACLDFGRGRWPRGIDWNWAFASGRCGDRTLGVNLGGKWTDGTGVTENGVVIDGRLHKISEPVDFAHHPSDHMFPWRVRSRDTARVDLRFVPRCERTVTLPLRVAALELHQVMGHLSGTIVDDGGRPIEVRELFGLAESLHARW